VLNVHIILGKTKDAPSTASSESLDTILTAQLQTCIAALRTNQQDVIIRMSQNPHVLHIELKCCSQLIRGGHEVWQSIIDVIKAISEVMMGTLPNFLEESQGRSSTASSKRFPDYPDLRMHILILA